MEEEARKVHNLCQLSISIIEVGLIQWLNPLIYGLTTLKNQETETLISNIRNTILLGMKCENNQTKFSIGFLLNIRNGE